MTRAMSRGLVAQLTLLLASRALVAQDSTSTPNLFLEKSYIAFGSPVTMNPALLFEALPAAHFYVWNKLADPQWQKAPGRTIGGRQIGAWKLTAGVSFLPEIRMSTDRSNPVRTPGYRIRTNTDLVHLSRGTRGHRLGFDLVSVGLTAFGHYSNGQSGCRLRGYSYRSVAPGTADSTCAPVDSVVAARMERNYDTGDFSTSYIGVAVRGRQGTLSSEAGPVKRQVSWALEYQLHPLGMRPGGLDAELRRDYGGHQVSVSVEAECRSNAVSSWSGVTRLATLGVVRFGPETRRIGRGQLELSHVFDRLHDAGVFARFHAGYDYYNIRLYERKPFWSFGVVWDVGRLDFFATEGTSNAKDPTHLDRCLGRPKPSRG